MTGLGDLSGAGFGSEAFGISADGLTVVGRGWATLGNEAFRWTATDDMIGLGDLDGGAYDSLAFAISGDGSTIVGWGSSDSGREAMRWTAGTGMVSLGDLAGGYVDGAAYDVTPSGSVIVGTSKSEFGDEAFVWDAANGMRSLRDVLINDVGLDLSGWWLSYARGISDDGQSIVGWGINPNGDTEAWVATLPEPTTVSLLVFAGLALIRQRNGRR
jgi:probable HAF family extracellular repeat protein